MSLPSRRRAIIELLVGNLLWGFGFIATRWALEGWGAHGVIALRFLLASVFGLPILLLFPRLRAHLTLNQAQIALVPGLLLSATLALQTLGLEHTSITNSGFITVLYALFVVPLEAWILKVRAPKGHVLMVIIALLGMALLSGFSADAWSIGDLLTLGCAFAGALHIIWISKAQGKIKSAWVFIFFQSFWAGVFPLLLWLVFPSHESRAMDWGMPILGMVFLVFGSTILGFLIQVRAQRVLSASVSGMLFLLEAPIAAFFAFFIFEERLNSLQLIGATMILFAAVLTMRSSAHSTGLEKKAHPI